MNFEERLATIKVITITLVNLFQYQNLEDHLFLIVLKILHPQKLIQNLNVRS